MGRARPQKGEQHLSESIGCPSCGAGRAPDDPRCDCGAVRPSIGWTGKALRAEDSLRSAKGQGWELAGPLSPEGPVLRYRARLPAQGPKPAQRPKLGGDSSPKEGVLRMVSEPALFAEMEFRSSILAGLRHPCLRTPFDHGRLRGRPFRLDADLSAPTVTAWIRERGPMPWVTVQRIGASLADALLSMHAAGLVHGHVCPDTVRLVESGDRLLPVLVDTPALEAGPWQPFATPELHQGNRPDPRADIFGLGIVLLSLLNGAAPEAIRGRSPWGDGRPGPAIAKNTAAAADPAFVALLLSMVDRYASRRPDSLGPVRELLDPSRKQENAPSVEGGAGRPVGAILALLLGLVGLIVAVVVGLLSVFSQHPG